MFALRPCHVFFSMRQEKLILPIGTPHIIVDPLQDFNKGAFVTCYGTEDTQPIRDVIRQLALLVEA